MVSTISAPVRGSCRGRRSSSTARSWMEPVVFTELAGLPAPLRLRGAQRAADQHRIVGAPRGGQGFGGQPGIGRLLLPSRVPRPGRRQQSSHRELARGRRPRRRLEQITQTVIGHSRQETMPRTDRPRSRRRPGRQPGCRRRRTANARSAASSSRPNAMSPRPAASATCAAACRSVAPRP